MKCVICKKGETVSGSATAVIESGKFTLVVKNVPADVCNMCGEEYINEEISAELLQIANDMEEAGAQIDIREYKAA